VVESNNQAQSQRDNLPSLDILTKEAKQQCFFNMPRRIPVFKRIISYINIQIQAINRPYDSGSNLTLLLHQANSSTWQQALTIRPNNNRGTENNSQDLGFVIQL
jgi:hypothetical protein